MSEDIEEVVKEEKSNFHLIERMKNRPIRSGEVTLYLDEVAGETHRSALIDYREAEAQRDSTKANYDILVENNVVGEPVTEAEAEFKAAEKRFKAAEKKLKETWKPVAESGITFHLHGVHQIVVDKALRETRKRYQGKGKDIPGDKALEAENYLKAFVLSEMIHKIETADEVFPKPTVDEVWEYRGYIPPSEWAILMQKFEEIQETVAVIRAHTEDAGF